MYVLWLPLLGFFINFLWCECERVRAARILVYKLLYRAFVYKPPISSTARPPYPLHNILSDIHIMLVDTYSPD